MEMWIAPASFNNLGAPIWFAANPYQYELGLVTDQVVCTINSPSGQSATTGIGPLQAGAWTHVACVYDGTKVVLYVNGLIGDCLAANFPIDTTERNGVQLGGGFAGGIDDVHVYARALSATDVCQLATGGTSCRSSCPPPPGPGPGPGPR
jgi:hypothetical protein